MPAKGAISLSGMLGSDMDDASDIDILPAPDSNQENEATLRGNGKKKAAPKGRRAKPASQRFSAKSKASKSNTLTKRVPLEEQTNAQRQTDEEPAEAEYPEARIADEIEDEMMGKKRGRRGKASAKDKSKDGAANLSNLREAEGDDQFEYTPTASRQKEMSAPKATLAIPKEPTATASQRHQAHDPQSEASDHEASEMEVDEVEALAQQPAQRQFDLAQPRPKQPRPQPLRNRTGSASETDRKTDDPALRRKLGDLTKRFGSLELKYRNLREVGIIEAEANFERLRKSTEERNKTANELITSLRKELAAQRALAAESDALSAKLAATTKSLAEQKANSSKLAASLADSQSENKVLQTRLAASRNPSVDSGLGSSRGPGSAFNARGPPSRTTAETAAARTAQLKEDMYSDLTGLILRGVDRKEDADVYDCIQTGRNGTLHFHLAVAKSCEPSTNPRLTAYEDIEFTYTPRLDMNRDAELLDILPDYLTEEITFSRMNAAKFYSRVADCLTKK